MSLDFTEIMRPFMVLAVVGVVLLATALAVHHMGRRGDGASGH
jgi:hypothetical protein